MYITNKFKYLKVYISIDEKLYGKKEKENMSNNVNEREKRYWWDFERRHKSIKEKLKKGGEKW